MLGAALKNRQLGNALYALMLVVFLTFMPVSAGAQALGGIALPSGKMIDFPANGMPVLFRDTANPKSLALCYFCPAPSLAGEGETGSTGKRLFHELWSMLREWAERLWRNVAYALYLALKTAADLFHPGRTVPTESRIEKIGTYRLGPFVTENASDGGLTIVRIIGKPPSDQVNGPIGKNWIVGSERVNVNSGDRIVSLELYRDLTNEKLPAIVESLLAKGKQTADVTILRHNASYGRSVLMVSISIAVHGELDDVASYD